MNNSSHIIEKVFLEVETSNIKTANSIKDNINAFLMDELFPKLEQLFDEYNLSDTIVRFDELNINISSEEPDNLDGIKYDFESQIREKLEKYFNYEASEVKSELLNSEPIKSGIKKTSITNNSESIFLFFLENGYLPWHGKEENITEFTKTKNWAKSLTKKDFLFKLKQVLIYEEMVINRFIVQFSDEIILLFLEEVNAEIAENKKDLFKVCRVLKYNFRVLFFKFLVQISLSYKDKSWLPVLKNLFFHISENEKSFDQIAGFVFLDELIKVIQKVVPEKVIMDFAHSIFENKQIERQIEEIIPESKQTTKQEVELASILKECESLIKQKQSFFEEDITEIAVRNAGLILLHPFINSFFKSLEFIDSKGSVKKEKWDVAVQSLHYLATGNELFFEANLILEKFLCGIPLKMPFQKESLLTDAIREEAGSLLNAAIKNWPALKNTSPGGLRQMFIHRDGKLIQKEKGFKLIVERKVQDVLLEKLNWNILIVKLPWKKEMLFVEW